MNTCYRLSLPLSIIIVLAGCARDASPPSAASPTDGPSTAAASTAPAEPSPTDTILDIMEIRDFVPLTPGTYFIDPDGDPSTPLRVEYEVAAEGWQQWSGAVKFHESDEDTEEGHVAVSITTVKNLVRHGCDDHAAADPPVGPSVDDLATALADLAPFELTTPPTDVTMYGYQGKHLELTVPDDQPVEVIDGETSFAGCADGNLWSWVWPTVQHDAFYGYSGPGYTEEFWILDADGTRLLIAAGRSAGSREEDLGELQAILDSIRVEP